MNLILDGTKARFPAWQHFSAQQDAQTACLLKNLFHIFKIKIRIFARLGKSIIKGVFILKMPIVVLELSPREQKAQVEKQYESHTKARYFYYGSLPYFFHIFSSFDYKNLM